MARRGLSTHQVVFWFEESGVPSWWVRVVGGGGEARTMRMDGEGIWPFLEAIAEREQLS